MNNFQHITEEVNEVMQYLQTKNSKHETKLLQATKFCCNLPEDLEYYDLQIEQLISNKKFNLLEKSLENVPQQPKINFDDLTDLANQIVPLRAEQLI